MHKLPVKTINKRNLIRLRLKEFTKLSINKKKQQALSFFRPERVLEKEIIRL